MVIKKQVATTLLTVLVQENRFAYVELDEGLCITAVSPNLAQFCELPLPLLGQPVTHFFVELVGVETVLAEVLAGSRAEFRLQDAQRRRLDGEPCYFHLRLLRLEANRLLLLVENATETAVLKQSVVQERNELRLAKARLTAVNEQLRRLDEFKNMFLSMAAHDLRTPLFVISGYLQMMLMAPLPDDQQELVDNALLQIQWLDHLVQDFLSLDKIERGEMVIQPQSVDMVSLVQAVVELFVEVFAGKQQTLVLDLPSAETAVWGEEGRLRQILFNLLSNASKYSLTNSIIRVSLAVAANQVVLQVADNGPGLTTDEQQHLFTPYYRTGAARQGNISGTGLGLFITKMLTEAHGGTIAVQSEPQKGTSFTVRLPQPPQ